MEKTTSYGPEEIERITKAILDVRDTVRKEAANRRKETGKLIEEAIHKKNFSIKDLAENIKSDEDLIVGIINGDLDPNNLESGIKAKLCIILTIPFDLLTNL